MLHFQEELQGFPLKMKLCKNLISISSFDNQKERIV